MSNSPTRAEKRAATAERILNAARDEFGERGVDGATIRGIARRAKIDPSLVLQHYGTKDALFALAVHPVTNLGDGDVAPHLSEVLDLRLRELPPATRALMRSMMTSTEAAEVMRTYLQDRIDVLVAGDDRPNAQQRAAILTSSILGMTIARHFLGIDSLGDMDENELSALVEPWFHAL